MKRAADDLKSDSAKSIINLYGSAPKPVRQSTWRSRALAAAVELAPICKAGPRQREGRRWVSYRMEVCPLTGESYPATFYDLPRIAVCPDGIVIYTMPHRQGDQMRELVTKLRAAGHSLPMMAEYEDPLGTVVAE